MTINKSVTLLYGAQNTNGDTFNVALAQPINKNDPNQELTFGLGISFGYQSVSQYSLVDVNGARLSSAAGGQDDCDQKYAASPNFGSCGNGTLLTVGGVGDSTSNPPDPNATPQDGCVPRCDDELYNLEPFVNNGDTSLTIHTLNPSNDDNIFFGWLVANPPATVTNGGGGTPIDPTESLGNGNKSWASSVVGVQALVGCPCNTATGNFTEALRDIAIPGRGLPLDVTRTYNSLAASTDGPFGFGWTFTYGASLSQDAATGNVTIHQENASQLTFTPSGGGHYSTLPRFIATLVKGTDGSFTFTRHKRQIMTFSSSGQLLKEADLNGYTTTITYDDKRRPVAVTDAAGQAVTLRYDESHIQSMTDPMGRTVKYDYDKGRGDLTEVRDVDEGRTRFTYDVQHRMLTKTDSRGGRTTNHYDTAGRVDWQSDELGGKTSFIYTPSTTTITDPKGNVTVDEYQSGERITETKGFGTPQAASRHYTYDPATISVTSVTDSNDHVTKLTYDPQGNPLTIIDALGRTTVKGWDELNDLTSATDPKGVKTTLAYDTRGNLLSRSTPLLDSGQTQTNAYHYADSAHPGDVTSMTDPNGKTWRYEYDANGDLVSQSDPLGNRATTDYNVIGWATSTTSAKGNVPDQGRSDHRGHYRTTFEHNHFGQVTEVTDPLGHSTTRRYDHNGNLVESRDGNGNITRYTYDAANEQTAITRADGTTLTTDYNPDGTVLRQADGQHNVTTYAYDALARVSAVRDPLGRTTALTYDGTGNLRTVTNPLGNVVTYARDAANQLTSITYNDGATPNVSQLTYDADGQRLTMTDGTGTSTYHYDSLNRLTASVDGVGTAVKYGYDLKGNLTSLTYPDGQAVSRGFDDAGRLQSVADPLGHTTTFGYDQNLNLTSETFPTVPQTVDAFSYDGADRLIRIVDARAGDPYTTFDY
ncbi:MAG: DUF6531 domain-containing protein, partial [Nitrospirota bacterium]|nr:DUF6531 domain-containing protein [Nitrospirota bacterium]